MFFYFKRKERKEKKGNNNMDSVAEKEITFFLVSRIIMVPYHFERLIMGGTCEEDLTAKISSLYKMSKTLTNNSCRHKHM